jgi:anti-sigma B factor antagonist
MDDRSPQLQIEILEVDDHERGAVLRMSGEIDLATVAKVREAFQELVDRKLTHLIVDASAVSFMDSTGLHALVEGKGAIHGAGSQVALIASPQVRRVLELVFPEPLFAARVDTMDQARAVLGW